MALANYTDLQASIAAWLHRTDLTSVIPDFVALAEARIARDLRIKSMVTETTLTTVAGTQSVALPTGWLEFENVTVSGSPDRNLNYVPVQHLNEKFPSNDYSGQPVVYSIEGDNILFGPVPDTAYSVDVLYYKRFDPLSTTATNWLLTNHPNIYLFAALAEAAPYVADDERVGIWEQKYSSDVARLQQVDDQGQNSGSVLRVRVN